MPHDDWPSTHLSELLKLKEPHNSEAWHQVVARYRLPLVQFCKSFGLQEANAEDLAQDVLIKLLKEMQRFQYDPTKSFRAWLRTVTRNAVRDAFRRNQLPTVQFGDRNENEFPASNHATPAEALVEAITNQSRRELMQLAEERVRHSVAPKTWAAFQARRTGKDAKTVATELGMSVDAVKKAKSRVVQKLRNEIATLTNNEAAK